MRPADKETEKAQQRYNRIAPVYDFMEGLVERSSYSKWRELLWSKVEGTCILEVGVGTGKNFPYYPPGAEMIAIDFSSKMLVRAKEKAARLKVGVSLRQMDVQQLYFDNNVFDSVVTSFVFCSVPDPVKGLKEIKRVCKPGGKLVMLEHVLSSNRILAAIMNAANPVVVRMMGANINRRTAENVALSGLVVEQVTDLAAGIFKLIEARKETAP